MARILLAFVFLTTTLMAQQSLQIIEMDTVVYGNAYSTTDIVAHINIKNVSSNNVDVKVRRIDRNYNDLTDDNAICWDVCFQTSISVSPTTITLAPGEETDHDNFSGHVYPDQDGVEHQGDITYVFYDVNNPTDSVATTVTYIATQTFDIKERKPVRQLEVFPNPASDHLEVNYDLNASGTNSFELINLVGNTVYRKELTSAKGQLSLDIAKLPRGVYFYVLRNEAKTLATRKLIIQ